MDLYSGNTGTEATTLALTKELRVFFKNETNKLKINLCLLIGIADNVYM